MKDAIANYINARAERLKPCVHNWEVISNKNISNKYNPDYSWYEIHYRCAKCCEHKKISTE